MGLDNAYMDLECYEFSVRAMNCFKSVGIKTVQDLVLKLEDELLAIKGFGIGTLIQVRELIKYEIDSNRKNQDVCFDEKDMDGIRHYILMERMWRGV